MESNKLVLTIQIDMDPEYPNVHITDNHGGSCDYGDGSYGNGLRVAGILNCVQDFLKFSAVWKNRPKASR